jgi:hypothetical protein
LENDAHYTLFTAAGAPAWQLGIEPMHADLPFGDMPLNKRRSAPKENRNDESMVEKESVHEHVAERVQLRGRLGARPCRERSETPSRERDDEVYQGHLRTLDDRPRAR